MSLSKSIKRAKDNSKIITPQLDAWLATDGNPYTTTEELERTGLRLLRGGGPNRDRSGAFSPSQLGSCQRAQMFRFIGAPESGRIDSTLQNVFNDGTFRHIRWQIMLLKAGILTDVEVPVHDKSQRPIRGSVDGINDQDGWGFELKGTSTISLFYAGPSEAHLLQVHGYMDLTGISDFVFIYEDKRTQDWVEHIVKRDNEIADVVSSEWGYLTDSARGKNLPPIQQECQNGTGTTYNRCPFREICLITPTWETAKARKKHAEDGTPVPRRVKRRPARVAKRT